MAEVQGVERAGSACTVLVISSTGVLWPLACAIRDAPCALLVYECQQLGLGNASMM